MSKWSGYRLLDGPALAITAAEPETNVSEKRDRAGKSSGNRTD